MGMLQYSSLLLARKIVNGQPNDHSLLFFIISEKNDAQNSTTAVARKYERIYWAGPGIDSFSRFPQLESAGCRHHDIIFEGLAGLSQAS
jgi:hypothetical protein